MNPGNLQPKYEDGNGSTGSFGASSMNSESHPHTIGIPATSGLSWAPPVSSVGGLGVREGNLFDHTNR